MVYNFLSKSRLTLTPSDEDLKKPKSRRTAAPRITKFRTRHDPNSVRHNETAGPSDTNRNQSKAGRDLAEGHKQEKPYEPWATVTTLPTSSTPEPIRRPTTSGTPVSTRRMESFYSCRDTSSPVPPHGGDDESFYTLDTNDRRAFTPSPLHVRERGEKSIFGHGDEEPVIPAELLHLNYLGDPSLHPAHRGVASDNVPDREIRLTRGYAKFITDGTMERRETPDRGGALADAAEAALEDSKKRNEDEMERQMREKQQKKVSDATTSTAVSSSSHAPERVDGEKKGGSASAVEPAVTVLEEKTTGTSAPSEAEIRYKTFRTFFMGVIVSMGGLIFGYGGIGQIGGFLNMPDYINRFGDETSIDGARALGTVRTGTIVGLLMIGALFGALIAAPITDRFGRKWCIALWAGVFIIGQVIEIATQRAWYQLVIGRTIEGLGIGGLSILTPLYMGEIAPKQIRGVMISCYQLFITTGILLACLVNLGTHKMTSSASWKITMGISLIWPSIMALGVLFLDESPRWDYRKGNIERAERTIAKTYTVQAGHSVVTAELQEIQTALDTEAAAEDVRWYDVFKAPTMLRRIAVGMTLQMLQQLTGINYFFSYATVLFKVAGVGDGYKTSVILGTVNFVATFGGLWVAGNVGHRKSLIIGGIWISICLFIYAAIGTEFIDGQLAHDTREIKHGGAVLVVFTCFAIVGFATTWGPLPWAVCAEIYPAQYRATSMAFATASNWTFNFMIAFFTPVITKAIGFKFGYVFAAALLAGAVFVFAMVHETKDKSLEAIDQMILDGVKPWKSAQNVGADRKDDA